MRTELFKLFYFKQEFKLHEKADAQEALDHILSVLHGFHASVDVQEQATDGVFEFMERDCNP